MVRFIIKHGITFFYGNISTAVPKRSRAFSAVGSLAPLPKMACLGDSFINYRCILLKRRRRGPVWPPGRNGGSRCPECEARRNTLGGPPPYGKFSNQFSTFNFQLKKPSGLLAIPHPPPQAAVPLYSCGAQNILRHTP